MDIYTMMHLCHDDLFVYLQTLHTSAFQLRIEFAKEPDFG